MARISKNEPIFEFSEIPKINDSVCRNTFQFQYSKDLPQEVHGLISCEIDSLQICQLCAIAGKSVHGSDQVISILIRGRVSRFSEFLNTSARVLKATSVAGCYSDYLMNEASTTDNVDSIVKLPTWSPVLLSKLDYLGPILSYKRSRLRLDANLIMEEESLIRYMLSEGYKLARIPIPTYQTQENAIGKPLPDRDEPLTAFEKSQNTISIVIPTAGKRMDSGKFLIDSCLATLMSQKIESPISEVVIVVDSDHDPGFQELNSRINNSWLPIKFVIFDREFNFSEKCNLGASNSTGDVIIFINDDVLLNDSKSIDALVSGLVTTKAGAAGSLLFYENLNVQHAGINFGVPKPKNSVELSFSECPETQTLIREVSAVTGALLAIKRINFELVNGWDEDLPNSYNDVALCFALRQSGQNIVLVPESQAIHLEAQSRNQEFDFESFKVLTSKWANFLLSEPFMMRKLSTADGVVKRQIIRRSFDFMRNAIIAIRHIGAKQILVNLRKERNYRRFVKSQIPLKLQI
jgi:GT2 family glycosyltransferase